MSQEMNSNVVISQNAVAQALHQMQLNQDLQTAFEILSDRSSSERREAARQFIFTQLDPTRIDQTIEIASVILREIQIDRACAMAIGILSDDPYDHRFRKEVWQSIMSRLLRTPLEEFRAMGTDPITLSDIDILNFNLESQTWLFLAIAQMPVELFLGFGGAQLVFSSRLFNNEDRAMICEWMCNKMDQMELPQLMEIYAGMASGRLYIIDTFRTKVNQCIARQNALDQAESQNLPANVRNHLLPEPEPRSDGCCNVI